MVENKWNIAEVLLHQLNECIKVMPSWNRNIFSMEEDICDIENKNLCLLQSYVPVGVVHSIYWCIHQRPGYIVPVYFHFRALRKLLTQGL